MLSEFFHSTLTFVEHPHDCFFEFFTRHILHFISFSLGFFLVPSRGAYFSLSPLCSILCLFQCVRGRRCQSAVASVRTACGVVWQAGCGWVGARSARGATQPECVPGGRTPPAGCSGVRLTFPLSPSSPSAPSLSWVLISKEEFCDFVFLSPFLPRAQVRRKALQEEIDRESGKTETSETRKLTVSLMLELCEVTLSSLDASPRHLAA